MREWLGWDAECPFTFSAMEMNVIVIWGVVMVGRTEFVFGSSRSVMDCMYDIGFGKDGDSTGDSRAVHSFEGGFDFKC